ncbi:GPP34 family phosphoprotein, partial [Frankia sp. AgB32]|uniref:GOLPH3/VPS74 family protein n=1 Tax=Frankia sp. AgB32 TaxID=631119 RepID=UPI0020101764
MDVTVAEKFFLLSLNDAGMDLLGAGSDVAYAAALLADLTMAGYLRLDEENRTLSPGPTFPAENPLARAAFDPIAAADPAPSLDTAVRLLAGELAPVREAVANRLVEEGVVGTEKGHVAGVFRIVRHPVRAPATAQAARDEVRLALAPGTPLAPSPDAAVLLAILRPFGSLDRFAPKDRRPEAAERAAALIDAAVLPRALGEVVQAVRSELVAMLAAVGGGGGGGPRRPPRRLVRWGWTRHPGRRAYLWTSP